LPIAGDAEEGYNFVFLCWELIPTMLRIFGKEMAAGLAEAELHTRNAKFAIITAAKGKASNAEADVAAFENGWGIQEWVSRNADNIRVQFPDRVVHRDAIGLQFEVDKTHDHLGAILFGLAHTPLIADAIAKANSNPYSNDVKNIGLRALSNALAHIRFGDYSSVHDPEVTMAVAGVLGEGKSYRVLLGDLPGPVRELYSVQSKRVIKKCDDDSIVRGNEIWRPTIIVDCDKDTVCALQQSQKIPLMIGHDGGTEILRHATPGMTATHVAEYTVINEPQFVILESRDGNPHNFNPSPAYKLVKGRWVADSDEQKGTEYRLIVAISHAFPQAEGKTKRQARHYIMFEKGKKKVAIGHGLPGVTEGFNMGLMFRGRNNEMEKAAITDLIYQRVDS
jgi:hypothetical protein